MDLAELQKQVKQPITKKCLLIAIAARDKNNIIGQNGKLPWHLSEDLKFFKQQTLDKPMIMGRKTRDSFGQKPLPDRPHLVISRDPDYKAEGSEIFNNFDDALYRAKEINEQSNHNEIYVIGGGSLYFQVADMVDRFLISEIDCDVEGDTYFPNFDQSKFSKKILANFTDTKFPFQIIEYNRLR